MTFFPHCLLLQTLVVLNHLRFLVFIPERSINGRNGWLAGRAIEAVAIWTLMLMLGIRSAFNSAFVFNRLCVFSIILDVIISVSATHFSYFVVSAASYIIISFTIDVIRILAWNLFSSFFTWIQYWFCFNGTIGICLASFSAEADSSCILRVRNKRKERLTVLFDFINWLWRSHHNVSALG